MSLKKPTALEYALLGVVNGAAAIFLALRHAWTAAYFVALALGCFWCAIRARSDASAPSR